MCTVCVHLELTQCSIGMVYGGLKDRTGASCYLGIREGLYTGVTLHRLLKEKEGMIHEIKELRKSEKRKNLSDKMKSLCERKKPDTFEDQTVREKRASEGAGAERRRRLKSPRALLARAKARV